MKKFLYSWYLRSGIMTLNAIYLAKITYTGDSLADRILPFLLSLGVMYCAVSLYTERHVERIKYNLL